MLVPHQEQQNCVLNLKIILQYWYNPFWIYEWKNLPVQPDLIGWAHFMSFPLNAATSWDLGCVSSPQQSQSCGISFPLRSSRLLHSSHSGSLKSWFFPGVLGSIGPLVVCCPWIARIPSLFLTWVNVYWLHLPLF